MSIFSGIFDIFTKPTKESAESVQFHKQESVKTEEAMLTIVIRAPKSMINSLEATLKNTTYKMLADDAVVEHNDYSVTNVLDVRTKNPAMRQFN